MKKIILGLLCVLMVSCCVLYISAEDGFSVAINGKVCGFQNPPYIENGVIMVNADEIRQKTLIDFVGKGEYISLRSFAEENGYAVSWDENSRTANLLCNKKYMFESMLLGRLCFAFADTGKNGAEFMFDFGRNSSVVIPSENGYTVLYADELLCDSVGNLTTDAVNLGYQACSDVLRYNDVEAAQIATPDKSKQSIDDACNSYSFFKGMGDFKYENMQYFTSYLIKLKDNSLITFTVCSDNKDVSVSQFASTFKSGGAKLKWDNEYIVSQAGQSFEIVQRGTSADYKYRMNVYIDRSIDVKSRVGNENPEKGNNGWDIYKTAQYAGKRYYPDKNSYSFVCDCGGFYKNEDQMKKFIESADQILKTIKARPEKDYVV